MEIDEAKFAELVGNAVQKIVEPLISRLDKLEAGNGNNDDQNHDGDGNDDQNHDDGKDGAIGLDDIIKENEANQKTLAARLSAACQNYGKDDKFSGKSL